QRAAARTAAAGPTRPATRLNGSVPVNAEVRAAVAYLGQVMEPDRVRDAWVCAERVPKPDPTVDQREAR
ncbi:hypothetical protein DZF91_25495, partial [Actinomadura logoneensis]